MKPTLSPREIRLVARGLLKLDRPRAIDRHIDYFGGPAGLAARLANARSQQEVENGVAGRLRQAVAWGGA
jgi:hypothetical protein